jgi:lysophospholipase L1-like esterase
VTVAISLLMHDGSVHPDQAVDPRAQKAGRSRIDSPMAAKPSTRAGNLIAAGVAIALTLLGLEAVLRWDLGRPKLGEQGERKKYTRFDPVLGWAKQPGGVATYRREEYTVEVRIDSHGLRDPERSYAAPVGTFRILALGDSFVEGYSVPLPETMTQVLERRLDGPSCPVQVVNGGTGGYSTDQEYLFYREEGVRYGPQVVVLFVFFNDVIFNARRNYYGVPKPFLAERDGQLVAVNMPLKAPQPQGEAAAADESVAEAPKPGGSALYRWIRLRLMRGAPAAYEQLSRFGLWPPLRVGPPNEQLLTYRLEADPQIEMGWRVFEMILRRLGRDVADRGGRLLVAYVPSVFEVVDRAWDFMRIGRGMKEGAWDRGLTLRRLTEITTRSGVPLLDLTPGLRRAQKWPRTSPYYNQDPHWNALGHLTAATSVEAFLRREGWLPACAR